MCPLKKRNALRRAVRRGLGHQLDRLANADLVKRIEEWTQAAQRLTIDRDQARQANADLAGNWRKQKMISPRPAPHCGPYRALTAHHGSKRRRAVDEHDATDRGCYLWRRASVAAW
jgi:hypothetical protein